MTSGVLNLVSWYTMPIAVPGYIALNVIVGMTNRGSSKQGTQAGSR